MSKSFSSQTRDQKELEFELDGEPYRVRVPKPDEFAMLVLEDPDDEGEGDEVSRGLQFARTEVDWYFAQFRGDGVAEEFRRRVADPDDDLSFNTIRDIVHWATEEGSGGVPTRSSSSGSSGRPRPGQPSRPSSRARG